MTRWKNALASAAVVVSLAAGGWMMQGAPAYSGGETRSISLYHIHTKESLTVTYMFNGRYVPSAMKKINYLMRDWRRNEVVTIDPKTIDLVWELHTDLGSKAPVHVVCGYRSSSTNGALKRMGRNVARKSQHIAGKAIDIYFPDVPTLKMRNSALVRQVGGVGYYRSSAGPTGFLHVDTGRVRHWGPGISAREMAKIFRDYRKTVGARLNRKNMMAVAEQSSVGQPPKNVKLASAQVVEYDDEELAELSGAASAAAPARPKLTLVKVPEVQTGSANIPKPRMKPADILAKAAFHAMYATGTSDFTVEPASAPPENVIEKPNMAGDPIGVVAAAETMTEISEGGVTSNESGKGSLAEALAEGSADEVPVLKAMVASSTARNTWWSPQAIIFTAGSDERMNGAPQPFEGSNAGFLPGSANAAEAEQPEATS
ncbi:MAG: DUF882 domain-containing protein, partial [Alphaproteobacteria bacterium]|nr:DUF882 domain-containing protein [Alphaproteobacteria bacterium]